MRASLASWSIILAVGLGSWACKKELPESSEKPEAKGTAAPAATTAWVDSAPRDVLAVVFLPKGNNLSEVGAVLQAIEPSAAAGVMFLQGQLASYISEMGKNAGGLAVSLGEPMRLVVLDPKKYDPPVVVIGTFTGTPTSPENTLSVGKERAVGQAKAIAAMGKWMATLPPAERLHAVGLPPNLLAAFSEELDGVTKMMAEAPSGAEGLAGFMTMYVGFVRDLAGATRSIEMSVESEVGRGTLITRIDAVPGSLFAKIIAAQKPAEFGFVDRLPMVEPLMVMEGTLIAGPGRDALVRFTRDYVVELAKLDEARAQAYGRAVEALADRLTGKLAAVVRMSLDGNGFIPKMEMAYWFGLEGEGDAKAVIDELFQAWGGSMTMLGLEQKSEYDAKAGTHAGVPYSKQVNTTAVDGMPPIVQTSYFAGLADGALMVSGEEAGLHKALDALRSGERGPPRARFAEAIAMARKRKASAFFAMDMAEFGAALPNPPRLPLMNMTFAFEGSVLDARMDFFAAAEAGQ